MEAALSRDLKELWETGGPGRRNSVRKALRWDHGGYVWGPERRPALLRSE